MECYAHRVPFFVVDCLMQRSVLRAKRPKSFQLTREFLGEIKIFVFFGKLDITKKRKTLDGLLDTLFFLGL